MTIQRVYGVCPHDCPDTCGLITEVENQKAINFYGNPDHPITQGWLCAKVRPYLEHVYHPGRLQYPLRRVGPKGSGQWEQISWQTAITEIAARWQKIIKRYGAEAILPYSYSGTLGLVQMTVSSARLWNRLGASQLERSICGEAAQYAVEATLGVRQSQPYPDVAHSKLVIIWGHNPASTAPHFMPHLKKAQRNGCKVIVIDPRRTRTARGADQHVAPLPGTDGALALGLAHIIVSEGLHNEAWLNAHSVGWPQLRDRLADYPPERVAEITGLPAEEIVDLAHRYADTRPGLIKIADGLQRHRNGGQTVRAICALPALTGQYGIKGGGLAYSTSGTVQWDSEAVNHWSECPPPGRWVNMNRLGAALLGEVIDPPIKSLFVFGANPVASSPNAGKIVAGLRRDDLFTVVHELFLTDTADYADIVLPAASQLEQVDLHKGYGHTVLSYNRQAIPPLGECKSNWDVMRLLAEAMGLSDPWLRQNADEVIEEIFATTSANTPALNAITLEHLKENGSVPLNLESTTPFANLHFPTPSGKVELYSQTMADAGLDPLPGWVSGDDDASPPDGSTSSAPLNLLTGAAHHFVSSTFAGQPGLLEKEKTPFVEIRPTDAAARNIADGDSVVVENNRGWCKLRAVVTDAVRPGVLVSPKGRWAKLDPFSNGNAGRNVNWTTSDALGDMAGQSTFHSNKVWIRKVEPKQAHFRFYAELNDFLPPRQRQREFTHSFEHNASIKDMIEAQGIPHTEIDLILVNGHSVDFSYRVQDGDRISVYPVFELLDVSPVVRLRPKPLRVTKFVLDVHLGRLATYLRMLGFDTLYRNDYDDDELALISSSERRILLTRDRGLLMRNIVTHGYWLRSTRPRQQLVEVLEHFDLFSTVQPFQRCLHCNGLLQLVDKAAISDQLQPKTRQYYDEFHQCRVCNRIYWKGSHYQHMRQFIDGVLQN